MIAGSLRVRRAFHRLRLEGAGAFREAAAVGAGVFIGCLPFYGFHLAIVWAVGWLLRLNRLKMYLAANISNPLVAPWLIVIEIQAGAWLRRGSFHPLDPRAIMATPPSVFGLDLLAGALFVGAVLGSLLTAATYGALRGSDRTGAFAELVRRASDRYLDTSVLAWEFARSKLHHDPVYRAALRLDVIGTGGTLVDIGCGQGLMLALLAEARTGAAAASSVEDPEAPRFDRLVGIETRRRMAALARRALGAEAAIIAADARTAPLDRARAVLIFDVLHMMGPADQEALLRAVVAALEPDGVILVREADASAGWWFEVVRVTNTLNAFVHGRWRQRLHFRTAAGWRDLFERCGLHAETIRGKGGNPLANQLFRLTMPRL